MVVRIYLIFQFFNDSFICLLFYNDCLFESPAIFFFRIRAVFGKDICKNAVHGSSNMDKAGHVIGELFPEVELLPNGRGKFHSPLDQNENRPTFYF